MTALMYAASVGAVECIKELGQLRAAVNMPSTCGMTAVMYALAAAKSSRFNINVTEDALRSLRLLVDLGADLDAADGAGKTILDYVNETPHVLHVSLALRLPVDYSTVSRPLVYVHQQIPVAMWRQSFMRSDMRRLFNSQMEIVEQRVSV